MKFSQRITRVFEQIRREYEALRTKFSALERQYADLETVGVAKANESFDTYKAKADAKAAGWFSLAPIVLRKQMFS